jgi:hypothetical protein
MTRTWSPRSLGNLKGIHPDLRRVMDRALRDVPEQEGFPENVVWPTKPE